MTEKKRASKKVPSKHKKPSRARTKPPVTLAAAVPDMAAAYDEPGDKPPPRWFRRLVAWLSGSPKE